MLMYIFFNLQFREKHRQQKKPGSQGWGCCYTALVAGASTQIAFSCFLSHSTPASPHPWRSNLTGLPSDSLLQPVLPSLDIPTSSWPGTAVYGYEASPGRGPSTHHTLLRYRRWKNEETSKACDCFCLTLNSALLCEKVGVDLHLSWAPPSVPRVTF